MSLPPASAFLLPLLLAASLAIFATSCSTVDPYAGYAEVSRLQSDINHQAEFDSESGFSWWDDDQPGHAPLRVTIDLSDQAAYFDRGGKQVGRSRVATGLPSHPTPPGSFTIMEKIVDKRSTLYGRIYDADGNVVVADADSRRDPVPEGGRFLGAAMPYWMRLSSAGVGMHAGPIPNPGRPASHGCIRMPEHMARRLHENTAIGTPVSIVY